MLNQQWNVLLASNDSEVIDPLLPLLQELDFNSTIVNRGGEVLLALLEIDFHLVILDTDLIGMSGIEAFPIVRRIRPRVPVILTSSHFSINLDKELVENGVLYRLAKPINPEEVNEIAKAFRRKMQFRSSELFNL